MGVKTPEFVIIDGDKALPKKRPSRKKTPEPSAALEKVLDNAAAIAPAALFELVDLLPRNEPYTPMIKAAVAGLKAYMAKQQDIARDENVAAVKLLWEQYLLQPDDSHKLKLDRAINRL
jgi:hypothetical protein